MYNNMFRSAADFTRMHIIITRAYTMFIYTGYAAVVDLYNTLVCCGCRVGAVCRLQNNNIIVYTRGEKNS